VTAPLTPVADTREDELLVVRCQLGERSAFDELIERWHPSLWEYVRRVTGDDDSAQDAVQDVWLRVLRGIHRLRDGSRLRAWLFGIAHHVVMDRLRSLYASRTVDGIDLTNIADDESPPDIEDDVAILHHELTQLPVIEREILTLFYLRELSLAEVAEVLAIPAGTVKSRLFRARRLLRHKLQSKGSPA
jgi:RNA polymerase sigma factor (sigma-70 family)